MIVSESIVDDRSWNSVLTMVMPLLPKVLLAPKHGQLPLADSSDTGNAYKKSSPGATAEE